MTIATSLLRRSVLKTFRRGDLPGLVVALDLAATQQLTGFERG